VTVGELENWLKGKDKNRQVCHAIDGEPLGFEDLALSVEEKPRQQNLFVEEKY
jgi:hypothetical protein